jgi:GTP1/Obg family GTP-binding protein
MTREDANKRILLACKRIWNEKTCEEIFKALEQEPCEKVAQERYADLCEYFGGAKDILKNRKDFKAWLERVKWHIHKAEELYEKYEYKKEPSGDLINRQDAIKAIDEKAKRIKNEDTLNGLAGAVGILFDLPSVKPQEKTGHWIIIDDCEKFIAKCSECGQIEDSRMIGKYAYCHCGAKMD